MAGVEDMFSSGRNAMGTMFSVCRTPSPATVFIEEVKVGSSAERGLPTQGYGDVVLELPFEATTTTGTMLEHQGSLTVGEQLRAATTEEMDGGEGENNILSLACQYSDETPRVLEVLPSELLMKRNANGDTALHVACSMGANKNIDALLKVLPPSALLEANDDGMLPLHRLVRQRRATREQVEKMMAAMPEDALHRKTAGDLSLMHFAAQARRGVAEAVLERLGEESLREKDSKGATPLMYACTVGDQETLGFLIERASAESLSAPDQERNLLRLLMQRSMRRVFHGDESHSLDMSSEPRAFERIYGALDLDSMDWSTGNPLMLAEHDVGAPAISLFELAVKRLPHKALTTPDAKGVTPWHVATGSRRRRHGGDRGRLHILAAQLTLEERSVASSSGINALHCAMSRSLLADVIDLVDPSCALQEDSKGRVPLALMFYCQRSPRDLEAMAKLIRMTAPALHTTTKCVVTQAIDQLPAAGLGELLLQSYPDGFLQSLPLDHWENGVSPLHSSAAKRGASMVEEMEMLLKYFKAFVSEPDGVGRTPLWLAAQAGKAELVRFLLPMTTRPLTEKIPVPFRRTIVDMSLPEAVMYGRNVEILTILLQHEPSLRSALNVDGKTLLQVAEGDERLRQVEGLLELLQPSCKGAM